MAVDGSAAAGAAPENNIAAHATRGGNAGKIFRGTVKAFLPDPRVR
jgi:hypothetical protein